MMAHNYPSPQEAESGGLPRIQGQSETQTKFWASAENIVKRKSKTHAKGTYLISVVI